MKPYGSEISLVQNSRGVYCIDTTMGCESGMRNPGGCYGDCYAARTAKRYGRDFGKTVLRKFKSEKHKRDIILQISKISIPFVRIGCSGDPSENWEHTISVLNVIRKANKEIVIITRHWKTLTDPQLQYLSTINLCINTSISALDKPQTITHSLEQHKRIKPYCKSVLRIVSCSFNVENETGKAMAEIQNGLFNNENIIDTVFRPSKNNPFVLDGIINVKEGVFNGGKQLMSKFNRKTYTGNCSNCHQMCGQRMVPEYVYPIQLVTQPYLF